ncbi:MAG: ABC transporter ATP-binding protein [Oscillospiraceae bacterium]|nr:ABC transporter ATP-binding protein [Oscillospiraceae bacterium]
MKVTLQNLTKTFPARGKGKKPVTAVDNFTLEIQDGELLALLGPSGCGKSTTLNLLCGLLEPSSGKLFFGDDDVTKLPAQNRGVGMVFQNYALYPHLTVEQNIRFPLENLKGKDRPTKEQMANKVKEAADLVQIGELLERKPSELSGGQQQRVAIARALVKMPRILLLDEPLSNLDARLRLQTREEIRRIQRATGITTVFVTHDQEEAMSISDRIVVMKDGLLHQAGKPQEVYDDPADLFVAKFLGTPPINTFDGQVKDGKLFLNGAAVLSCDAPDGDVVVAIRPEGFLPGEGSFICCVQRLEVMGRDTSLVCNCPCFTGEHFRVIIDSDDTQKVTGTSVSFGLKPGKVFLFDKETGCRIRCNLGE